MANIKYFAECGGQAVELKNVWHKGNGDVSVAHANLQPRSDIVASNPL